MVLIAGRNKINSSKITYTTIIQNVYSDKSDKFEDANVSYIGRGKYTHGFALENIHTTKCDLIAKDIKNTTVDSYHVT